MKCEWYEVSPTFPWFTCHKGGSYLTFVFVYSSCFFIFNHLRVPMYSISMHSIKTIPKWLQKNKKMWISKNDLQISFNLMGIESGEHGK